MSEILSNALVGVKEDVTDEFMLLNHYQIPLTSQLGFSAEVGNTTHLWYEDTMYAKQDVINNGAVVAPTDLTITVTDGTKFRVGFIVKFYDEDELMEITGIATNVLTVARTYSLSTLAPEVADGTLLIVQFIKGVEGADARDARYKPRIQESNLTQIFDDSIEISGTAEAVLQWGVDNEYIKEQQKKLAELGWQLENALVNGVKSQVGSTTSMNGIRAFITTNTVNAAAAAISEDIFNQAVFKVWEAGGFRNGGDYIFMMGPTQKRQLAKINSDDLRVPHTDQRRGVVVDSLVTDYGTFPVVINDHLKPSEIMFVDRNRMMIRPLRTRSWFHTYMGKEGDKTLGTIVGEYTFQFEQEEAHSIIYGLATA